MDYDSYEIYERNFPTDSREEAELTRERSRRLDRQRREREDDLLWDQDRNRERYGSAYVDSNHDGHCSYRDDAVRYEDIECGGKDNCWEGNSGGMTYDYNHGFSGRNKCLEQTETDAGGYRNANSGIQRDIKDDATSTIFLGGIPRTLDERDIENELICCGIHATDIRVIRQKETGANRGFAFVDFHSVADAQRWMELNQGRLFLRNRFTISMDYSKNGFGGGAGGGGGGLACGNNLNSPGNSKAEVIYRNDWKCSICGCDNFRRRLQCFKCGLSKEESDNARQVAGDGRRQLNNSPSSTLIIRGLDGLTTESSVICAFSEVTNCHIHDVCLVRDEVTGMGRGYGYVEFNSKQEGEEVMEKIRIMDYQLEIDGKGIMVDFSRESFVNVLVSLNQLPAESKPGYYNEEENDTYGHQHRNASPMRTTKADHTRTSTTSRTSAEKGRTVGCSVTTNDAPSDNSQSTSDNEYYNYAAPDLNRFVFDDATGYYIDPVTSLYYDAGTQYFYNMQTNSFLYWDPDKNGYQPAMSQEEDIRSSDDQTNETEFTRTRSKVEDEKSERTKTAQKIAKEMEKWAKLQNAQKDTGFKKPLAPVSLPPKTKQLNAATADAGFNVLAKSKFSIELSRQKDEKKAVPAASSLPGLVAYGGDSDSDGEEGDAEDAEEAEKILEEKLIDWEKLSCLLCRRAFQSAAILQKHQEISDLHKKNLEEYKKKFTGTVTRAATVR